MNSIVNDGTGEVSYFLRKDPVSTKSIKSIKIT